MSCRRHLGGQPNAPIFLMNAECNETPYCLLANTLPDPRSFMDVQRNLRSEEWYQVPAAPWPISHIRPSTGSQGGTFSNPLLCSYRVASFSCSVLQTHGGQGSGEPYSTLLFGAGSPWKHMSSCTRALQAQGTLMSSCAHPGSMERSVPRHAGRLPLLLPQKVMGRLPDVV